MTRIRNAHYSWLIAGFLLLVPGTMATAQKRLPIGGSTVPPVTGTGSATGTVPASDSGSHGPGSTGPGSLGIDDTGDSTVRRNMDAIRSNIANVERQRILTHETDQLLQMAADLHLKIASNSSSMSQAEMLHQIDTIEKLARNVKERMKGAR
jgi:hypothetical protein